MTVIAASPRVVSILTDLAGWIQRESARAKHRENPKSNGRSRGSCAVHSPPIITLSRASISTRDLLKRDKNRRMPQIALKLLSLAPLLTASIFSQTAELSGLISDPSDLPI